MAQQRPVMCVSWYVPDSSELSAFVTWLTLSSLCSVLISRLKSLVFSVESSETSALFSGLVVTSVVVCQKPRDIPNKQYLDHGNVTIQFIFLGINTFRAQLRLTLSQAAERGFGMSYEKEPNHIYAKEHQHYLLISPFWRALEKLKRQQKSLNNIFARKWAKHSSSFSSLISFPHDTIVWFSLFISLF